MVDLGSVRIDLATGESALVKGLDPDSFPRYDRTGRRFRMFAWHEHPASIKVTEPSGKVRYVAEDQTGGMVQNLWLAEDGGTIWAFWLWRPRSFEGEFTLYRANAETGEIVSMPLPAMEGEPDTGDDSLSAQDRNVVFLTEERSPDLAAPPYYHRTWRGDLRTGEWTGPIEGSFVVIDRGGTLLERRDDSWLSDDRDGSDSRITVIRDGKRETVDLGYGGWAHPVFGTGYVRVYDLPREEYVFRSLEGKPDIRVPRRPPPFEGTPEIR